MPLSREYNNLRDIISAADEADQTEASIASLKETLVTEIDLDLRKMAADEIELLAKKLAAKLDEIKEMVAPRDPMDGRNIIMEIRAGTGGDEAALFAADLFRMYSRYAERKGWKTSLMSSSHSELGGFKEVIFAITGKNVYSFAQIRKRRAPRPARADHGKARPRPYFDRHRRRASGGRRS